MNKLQGRYAVVTGAARGIGAAIVKKFLEEGVEKVAILDLNQIDTTAVDPTGKRAFSYACNVSSEESVNAVFAQIYKDFGRIDILVNNAGITRDAMFHKMTTDQWMQVVNVNLNSAYFTCRAVIGGMREQCYGRIVNIASSSIRGNVGQCNYAATKCALEGLSRSLAKESGRKNITVNCVAPGATNTDMYKTVPEEIVEATKKSIPSGRLAEPSEIAAAVCFLACEEASYVSGQTLLVNAGK